MDNKTTVTPPIEEEKMIETMESRQVRARELMNRADWQITKEDVLDGEALFYSRKRGNSPLRMDLCAEIVFLMRKLDRLRELPSPPPSRIAELEKIMAMYEATAKLSPQPQPDKPTFAHSLAGYLTRNGQTGDWEYAEKEIQQFMEDSKLEVTRAKLSSALELLREYEDECPNCDTGYRCSLCRKLDELEEK